jgi:agmatinase
MTTGTGNGADDAGKFRLITTAGISALSAPYVTVADLAALGAKAAFLGVPFDTGSVPQRPGSAAGVRAVRAASTMTLPWSSEWDIDLAEVYRFVDCGDVPVVPGDAKRTHKLVEDQIHAILTAGAIPIAVGGDDSLPIPGARALSRFLGPDKRMGYLQIDAHLDASHDILGQTQSNASGIARASELENLRPANMAVIGARGTLNTRDWWEFVRERGVSVYSVRAIRDSGFEATTQKALERVWDGVDAVYVAFDVDSIDPAFAPGAWPEPGGFTSDEIIRLAQMVGRYGVAALNCVEIFPMYDPGGITARLAWEVVMQMLYAHAKYHLE